MANVKIRMLDSVAGTEFSASAGEEVEVDSKVAKAWLEGGLAEPVASRSKASKRVVDDAETR